MGDSTFDYHKDRDKTLAARARGMFTVGDIGYLDADGYLYLCDRKGDMIISGGVNIYPAEIESELSCHPAVDDVAVFGIPHEEWGEEIKAVVQPVDGITPGPELTASLLDFLDGADRQVQAAEDHRLRRRNCRASRTGSCTSGASAIRTGPRATRRSKTRTVTRNARVPSPPPARCPSPGGRRPRARQRTTRATRTPPSIIYTTRTIHTTHTTRATHTPATTIYTTRTTCTPAPLAHPHHLHTRTTCTTRTTRTTCTTRPRASRRA